MVFSSAIFLFWFLPLTFLLYHIVPNKVYQNRLLIVASLIFYAFGQLQYLPLLLFSVFCNYVFGRLLLEESYSQRIRRNIILTAAFLNVGILCVYKYTDFFIDSINHVLGLHIPLTGIPLPIGISFFTFQGISYVIDVYRNPKEGTNSFEKVLLYIAFFPQLVAGPIIKYHDIAQEMDKRICTPQQTAEGLRRFSIGLAKKMLLSNPMGFLADSIFALSGAELDIRLAWLGAIAYVLQIYFDFSGYSDMAIGLGRVFGFHFKENFNYPYVSDSIKEFWRRWHISLSSWFRDYLYIPLGGNRMGTARTALNKGIVFFATGFWHGANVTFILWGLFHGLFSVLEESGIIPSKKMQGKWIGHVYTMLVVTVGFVLFRAENLLQAGGILTQMFAGFHITAEKTLLLQELLSPYYIAVFVVAVIASTGILPKWQTYIGKKSVISGAIWNISGYAMSMVLLIVSIIDLSASTFNPFIYFQF